MVTALIASTNAQRCAKMRVTSSAGCSAAQMRSFLLSIFSSSSLADDGVTTLNVVNSFKLVHNCFKTDFDFGPRDFAKFGFFLGGGFFFGGGVARECRRSVVGPRLGLLNASPANGF